MEYKDEERETSVHTLGIQANQQTRAGEERLRRALGTAPVAATGAVTSTGAVGALERDAWCWRRLKGLWLGWWCGKFVARVLFLLLFIFPLYFRVALIPCEF